MTYPGVAFAFMVGIGLGVFLYYMFGENNEERQRYNNENHHYEYPSAGPSDPRNTSQDENFQRTRRRKRGSTASNGKSTCTICLTELVDKASIQVFPCQHEFHRDCITTWQQRGPMGACDTCPNCREGIDTSSKW